MNNSYARNRPEISREELDQEIDAYMAKTKIKTNVDTSMMDIWAARISLIIFLLIFQPTILHIIKKMKTVMFTVKSTTREREAENHICNVPFSDTSQSVVVCSRKIVPVF